MHDFMFIYIDWQLNFMSKKCNILMINNTWKYELNLPLLLYLSINGNIASFTFRIFSADFPSMYFLMNNLTLSSAIPVGSGLTGKQTKLSSSLASVSHLQNIILAPNKQCSKIRPYPYLCNPITCKGINDVMS